NPLPFTNSIPKSALLPLNSPVSALRNLHPAPSKLSAETPHPSPPSHTRAADHTHSPPGPGLAAPGCGPVAPRASGSEAPDDKMSRYENQPLGLRECTKE
ncbi:MAG: hypothetical protein ACK56I_05165, partial [bacterium]